MTPIALRWSRNEGPSTSSGSVEAPGFRASVRWDSTMDFRNAESPTTRRLIGGDFQP